ncbi:MAG: hypothetical protein H0T95_02340 [Chthoniobacterales bacterium]|nr:hypothetical protein [Chthoniobacterales bacterium]
MWRDYATGALPILGCFLGGATEKWAEGIVVALLGLLLAVLPPQHSLGMFFDVVVAALVACPRSRISPRVASFSRPGATALVNDLNPNLASTLRRFTAQPGAPAYFHFLEAEGWSVKQNWERAWQAWQQFEATKSSHS